MSISGIALILGIFLASFLIGSIPFAIVVTQIFRLQDPRTFGSGNPGATNVLRSGHKLAAALTLLGDAFKGWLVVTLVAIYTPLDVPFHGLLLPIAMLGVFAGHIFSIFLHFKGGKGVATSLGVILALSPALASVVLIVWLLIALMTGYSSLAAILAAIAAPIFYLFRHQWTVDPVFFALMIMMLLLIWRHRVNIQRLIQGKEAGFKKR